MGQAARKNHQKLFSKKNNLSRVSHFLLNFVSSYLEKTSGRFELKLNSIPNPNTFMITLSIQPKLKSVGQPTWIEHLKKCN